MGMIGFGFVPRHRAPAQRRPLATVAAAGWFGTSPQPAASLGSALECLRPGFASDGSATTHADTLVAQCRVRRPFPDQALLSAESLALSDWLYAGDVVRDTVNLSMATSPKPVAQWAMPSRLTVAGSIDWEIIAFHRDARPDPATGVGRQVACVRVRATDGTATTPWQTVSETRLSQLCEDGQPVEVFAGTLDIAALGNGLIRLEAEVLPWLGGTSSIRSTADDASRRGFSPRFFRKDPPRAAAPPLAYVSTTGNNATGVWSTDAATARANPFATDAGARDALYTGGAAVTGGLADGCEIRFMTGTHTLTTSNGALKKPQAIAALIYTRDPASPSRASVTVRFGSAGYATGLGVRADGGGRSLDPALGESAILFRDLTVQRTGALSISGTSFGGTISIPVLIQWWNVAFDNGGQASSYCSNSASAGAHDAIFGMTMTGLATSGTILGIQSGVEHRIVRGLVAADAMGAAIQAYALIGCRIGNPGTLASLRADEGLLVYGNRFSRSANHLVNFNGEGNASLVTRLAVVQNVIEHCSASLSLTALSLFAGTGGSRGAIVQHNTIAGARTAGRSNFFYTGAGTIPAKTDQVHEGASLRGNLLVQFNIKGDIFGASSALTGNFALVHGTGAAANFSAFCAQAPSSEHPRHAGAGSRLNGDLAARSDPRFVDDRASRWDFATSVLSAGPGGGDYRLQPDSPARAVTSRAVLAFDLDGQPRLPGPQPGGAHV